MASPGSRRQSRRGIGVHRSSETASAALRCVVSRSDGGNLEMEVEVEVEGSRLGRVLLKHAG